MDNKNAELYWLKNEISQLKGEPQISDVIFNLNDLENRYEDFDKFYKIDKNGSLINEVSVLIRHIEEEEVESEVNLINTLYGGAYVKHYKERYIAENGEDINYRIEFLKRG